MDTLIWPGKSRTTSSYVRIRNVALKTCQRRRTIGRSGDRGSGISMLVAQHDDDDDDNIPTSEISFVCTQLNDFKYCSLMQIVLFSGLGYFQIGRGVMVIVVGNGKGYTSSNPGRD